jgi:hypothetical protein
VTLTLASGRALTLSPRHFIPVAAGADDAWDARVAKGADEVRVGDFVWSAAGAYNPLTLNGTIVVDGVVASAHSDWFLDGVVPADTPARVYQAILAPVRVAYRAMGPDHPGRTLPSNARSRALKTRSSAASASASVAISRARSSSATVPSYIDARGPERRR